MIFPILFKKMISIFCHPTRWLLFVRGHKANRVAMARIAAGTHETVSLQAGDTVIYSSRQIPGNETAIARVQDMLIRRNINLVTDVTRRFMSGHPSRDEMVDMYD